MKIIFFGDSICFGQFVSPHKTWVTQISRKLEIEGYKFWLNNISHSGDTTRMALEKMPFDVQAHGIDILYIQFGMNDCHFWETNNGAPRVNKEAFEANLVEIIERAEVSGAKSILIGVNHITSKEDRYDGEFFSYQDSNRQYNDIVRKVAKRRGAIIVDHEKRFKKEIESGSKLQDLLLQDRIHLSHVGHSIYFNNTYPLLIDAIKSIE